MVLQNAKVRRELFTQAELERLEESILVGEISKIMNVLDEITPEKEIEMQRLINYLNPLQDGFESKVRAQMEKELPNGPQTPEEEQKWEAMLQTEFKEFAAQQEIRNKKLAGEEVKEEAKTIEKTNAEVTPEAPEKEEANEAPTVKPVNKGGRPAGSTNKVNK